MHSLTVVPRLAARTASRREHPSPLAMPSLVVVTEIPAAYTAAPPELPSNIQINMKSPTPPAIAASTFFITRLLYVGTEIGKR